MGVRAIVAEQTPRAALGVLRARLDHAQGRRPAASVLPVPPALADLLPEGGLRPGAAYALGSATALLTALLAGPSGEGMWCGAVGMPELGVEAAEQAGVDLSRLVLIPDPGSRWLAVTATVAEVLSAVAVRPRSPVSDADAARLAARLRDHGAVLLVQGAWPRAEATFDVDESAWAGIGAGHGCLAQREVTVSVVHRRSPVPRRARMLLPDASGRCTAMPAERSAAVFDRLRAVG